MRCFSAPSHALKIIQEKYGTNYITVSLRTNRFQPLRNSNIESWSDVCDYIASKGFQPIIIPDFEDYFAEKSFKLINHPVAFEAIFDLALRVALYEKAKYNLGVSNGTVALFWHSKVPYSVFKIVTPGINNSSAEYWKEKCDVDFGENFWFMGQNQHLLWTDDSKDIIIAHLEHVLNKP